MEQSRFSRTSEPFATSVAIELNQPFGRFYVAKLTAATLLTVCFVEELQATTEADEEDYKLKGTQRGKKKSRLVEIGEFIETTEAAFPNSIILAANYRQDGTLLSVNGEDENDDFYRWRIEERDDGCLELVIPTGEKLANVIDGQHRLYAFESPNVNYKSKDMELLCSIYLDLPSAYQGYIFATINFNQKSVNKSLAYQLYGLTGVEEIDKKPETWSPDRAAVAISKRLNLNPDSPFHRRIIVSAQNENLLFPEDGGKVDWRVSTATVVDGILKLFSKNPKYDRHQMFKDVNSVRSRTDLQDDGTPLRKMFLNTNDLAIYSILRNYFTAVKNVFWDKAKPNSYIEKTVGIQALFDILFFILSKYREKGRANVQVETFTEILNSASSLDFSTAHFQQASGIGRVQMREAILQRIKPILEIVLKRIEEENKTT